MYLNDWRNGYILVWCRYWLLYGDRMQVLDNVYIYIYH